MKNYILHEWRSLEEVKVIPTFEHQTAEKLTVDRPQATLNGLHTDFFWRRGVEPLKSGLISWNDCYCDGDTELNEKLYVF